MKIRSVLFLCSCITSLYIVLCIILYNLLEGKGHVNQAARWFYEEYVSSEQPCFMESVDNQMVNSALYEPAKTRFYRNNLQCVISEQSKWKDRADIIIENEMDKMRISYPKYAYSVSGFLQTLKVDSWNIKRLKVIIMLHSHQDPGWKRTFNQYFLDFGKRTLDNMLSMQLINPDAKFVWSEMVILAEWWKQAEESQKDKFKRLVHNGKIEITTGGWVMTDEATSYYTAMLDQLIEGHQWLKQNIGVEPRTGWSVDPFGHSPTMAYLLKTSNIKSMVIQRVHYSIKQDLARYKNLEFNWRQGWASDTSKDILCHMMPFLSYSIPFSCGPDPQICCQYDFFRKQCYHGNQKYGSVPVDDNNIDHLARQLWEQFQKKAELYRTGVILVPHGDDFRYESPSEWKKQINNMGKLMKYINAKAEFQTEVKFGTLSGYFWEVYNSNTKFPTLSGDFFTYSERDEDYWSGYYTSRPHYKQMVRCMQDLLRSLEILFTYSMASAVNEKNQTLINFLLERVKDLSYVRQQVALFQHHDAITGTSAYKVMMNYGKRLHAGYVKATKMLEKITSFIIQTEENRTFNETYEQIIVNSNWTRHEHYITENVIHLNKTKQLLLYNSLNSVRLCVIRLHIDRPCVKVVSMETNKDVKHQVSPVIESGVVQKHIFELSIRIDLPALSLSRYLLSPSSSDSNSQYLSSVKVVVDQNNSTRFPNFNIEYENLQKFSISNDHLTATFYTCDGKLQYITKDDSATKYKTQVKMMTYGTGSWTNPFKDKSGAYLFLPDGNAKILREQVENMYFVNGAIYTSVVLKYPSLVQIYTLYKNIGTAGMGIHIENIVDISNGSVWDNKELVMRIETEIKDTDHEICVDLNGFQMHRKKTRRKLPIQGNFYPMTSMAFIENEINRMTLISSETHGVASLSPGWLEVVLDRRLIQDDWKGLSEGVIDNAPTRSQFVLLFEGKPSAEKQKNSHMCYPSPSASIVARQLDNKVISMTIPFNSLSSDLPVIKLSSASHSNIEVVNLRFVQTIGSCFQTLLVIHKTGLDCSFPVAGSEVNFQNFNPLQISEMFKGRNVTRIEQTTLTGTKTLESLALGSSIDIDVMELKTFKLTIC